MYTKSNNILVRVYVDINEKKGEEKKRKKTNMKNNFTQYLTNVKLFLENSNFHILENDLVRFQLLVQNFPVKNFVNRKLNTVLANGVERKST